MIAQYDGQCASCGQVFRAGDSIHYYPASGDVAVRTEHISCPERKKSAKGQNVRPTFDPELLISLRECAKCGTEYSVPKHVATSSPFVCSNTEMCNAYVASRAKA